MTRRAAWAGPALGCVLLAVVHTWPLATAPWRLANSDSGDAQLNAWILAWVAHALAHGPAHVFQANIFYPARDTLAFSEPLMVPALMGAPLAWLGGSAVLVFNVMLIAGFALTALAAYALMFAWTEDRAAALLAGSTFAFNTHTLTRLSHVQGLHIYGLPLALLATDRLITTGRARDAWWLALWMVVMAYTSGYLLVFGAVMVGVAIVARVPEWSSRVRSTGGRLLLATVVSAAAILPLAVPYQRVAREQRMVRTLDSVGEFSATPGGYLAASGRIHVATWSGSLFKDPVDSFFPGFTVIVFALWAIVSAARSRNAADRVTRRRVLMLVGIAAAGFVLSLGTHTPLYGWLYRVFPPMHGLRAAARFGNLFLLGMSALAGLGLWRLRAGASNTGRAIVIAAVAVTAANIEALRAPIAYRPFAGVPRLYALLRAEPHVVLAEVPFYPRHAAVENADYVLNSTAHWRPLMNGYSGYTPASYTAYADIFWYFPEAHAIDAMRRAGVTHVMVHRDRFGADGPDVIRQLSARADFELMGVSPGGLHLYRLRR